MSILEFNLVLTINQCLLEWEYQTIRYTRASDFTKDTFSQLIILLKKNFSNTL